MAPKPKAVPPRRGSSLKDRPPMMAPPPINRQSTNKARKQKVCPSKTCNSTRIEDGICIDCGVVVEEVNIVSEVQFGETSSGAAMVQGTYISADKGGATSMGIGGRGEGGGSRAKTIEEGESKRIFKITCITD